jgi:hypothetical protein
MWEIEACDANSGRLTLRLASGATRLLQLSQGYVLLTPALREALAGGLTREMRDEKAKRAEVASFGFTTRIEKDDLDCLCEAVQSARSGRLPSPDERKRLLGAAEKYGPARPIMKLANAWLEAGMGEFLPDVLISLVAHLRHAGRTQEALDRTDVLLQRGLRMTDMERMILFTERAAICADRYEQTGDREHLREARRCANTSWANGPSDHCSMVYRRIEMLEQGHRR